MKLERMGCDNCRDEFAIITLKFNDAIDDSPPLKVGLCLNCWRTLKYLVQNWKEAGGFSITPETYRKNYAEHSAPGGS